MKKNFIPAAALTVAVALVSLGSLSSCKSEKAAENETVAVEEVEEGNAVLTNSDTSSLSNYGPDFFGNPEKKSSTPSDSTYVQTPSGLKYVVVTEGNGASPGATDIVTVHYTGVLTDGTVFDSSVSRGEPATFPLNHVIPGWTEGLQLMKEGGKTIFYIPSELGYGEAGAPGGVIPPNSPLIFEVDLIKVN